MAVVLCGAGLVAITWAEPARDARRPATAAVIHPLRPIQTLQPESLDAQEQRLRTRNPFGFASVPEATQPPQFGMPVPPVAPHMMPPQVALQGVAGPPWTAVLSGLPGRPNQTVVMVGDTVGSARIRAIRRDTVVVQLGDSTVRLSLVRGIR